MLEGAILKDLVEAVARKLVQHPDDVQVRVSEEDGAHMLELRVNSEDMGRVIGREGRTAKAIRTILTSAAAKKRVEANLQIVE